jgi:magnesium-transporting ATPase (P-type)
MKKFFKTIFIIVISLAILAAVAWLLSYWYDHSNLLQSTFGNAKTVQSGIRIPTDDPNKVETISADLGGKISLLIFTIVLLMQVVAVVMIAVVVRKISHLKGATLAQKDAAFKDADIFLDLPLYIGLFGSVSSFVLIAFSPQSSRLVAYSSTLIGIIFSVCSKLCFLYPIKQKLLLQEIAENNKE